MLSGNGRRPKVYDLFQPERSLLAELYDGVRSRDLGSQVVTMSYEASEHRTQSSSQVAYACSTLVFHRRGHRDFSLQYRGGTAVCNALDGQVSLLPAHLSLDVRYRERCEGLVVGFSPVLVGEVANELGLAADFPVATGLDDPTLAAMSESFWSAGAVSPRFVDALGKAMLVHLMERHSSRPAFLGALVPGWLKATQSYIQIHLHRHLSLDELAEVAGLSRAHFARSFKQATGDSPLAFVTRLRLERARTLLLEERDRSLSSVAASVGFCDQSHFTSHFRKQFGVSPASYRRNPSTPIPKISTPTQDRLGLSLLKSL